MSHGFPSPWEDKAGPAYGVVKSFTSDFGVAHPAWLPIWAWPWDLCGDDQQIGARWEAGDLDEREDMTMLSSAGTGLSWLWDSPILTCS